MNSPDYLYWMYPETTYREIIETYRESRENDQSGEEN